MSFLTIEDVNGAIYSNQGFYWHSIDISKITTGNEDLDNVKYDFCEVKRVKGTTFYTYTITVHNLLFAKAGYVVYAGTTPRRAERPTINGNEITFKPNISYGGLPVVYLYMGFFESEETNVSNIILNDTIELTLKQLESPQTIRHKDILTEGIYSTSKILNQGYNFISTSDINHLGYVFVKLAKTDFQFTCNQSVTVGKVNKVALGTATDYKPNGDLIGEYTPNIRVIYKGKTLPVSYDETLTDYVFNLDLTDITEPSKIKFTVEIDANDVINSTSTEVKLQADYETINNLTGLTNLINNGGVGRLGANITLTNPLTINRDVYLIGNDKTINLNSKQIIIGTGRTFKAEKTTFTTGVNSIHQKTSSTVELTDCTFSGCTGTGSIIECDIELHSLDNPTDFTTKLTGCTFTNNDLCILHGGELTVENCTITGKISNPNYPYFLYQTDGSAILLRNTFNLSSNTTINTDIEFNSCIFICGETAQINGLSHTELKNNNVNTFLETPQNNTSSINVTYYYDVIEDNITLQSNKGYCHTVSGEDTIYKTNITATRS